MYERGKEVLEVGLAWTKGTTVWPKPIISCRHFITSDHLSLHNSLYVPDNCDQFNEEFFADEPAVNMTVRFMRIRVKNSNPKAKAAS
jgi:hypothetical protein